MPLALALLAAALLAGLENVAYRGLWARGLRVTVKFADKAAFEGGRSALIETVANAKLLPLPLLQVKLQIGRGLAFDGASRTSVTDDDYRSDAFTLPPYRRATRRLGFVCPKRGYYPLKAVGVVCANVLMNLKMTAACPFEGTAVMVYPRLVDARELEPPLTKLMGDVTAKRFSLDDPFTFRGVRPYQWGDPPGKVNHRATARAGELMVNETERTVSGSVVIVLNFERERAWPDADVFEESIRLAATLAARLTDMGVPFSFITNGTDGASGAESRLPAGAGGGQFTATLEALARVGYGQTPQAIAPRVAELAMGDTIVALVSNYAGADLRAAYATLRDAVWLRPRKPGVGRDDADIRNLWAWAVL